jgi:zinc protease
VFTHPNDRLAWARAALETITPEQCVEALRKGWNSEDLWIFVSGNLVLKNGDQAIRDAFLKSRQVAVQRSAEQKQAAWTYTNFGPAGRVVRREEVKDLGLTLVTFANNVRLNLKPTDFEKGTIAVKVNFGAGKLTMPGDKPGLDQFAEANFIYGGLDQHDLDEVKRLIAGKKVGATLNVNDEFFTLSGTTNRAELNLQLQLLCAYLTAPGFRSDGVQTYKQKVEAKHSAAEHSAEGNFELNLDRFLYLGDVRFATPRQEELQARTMAELKEWLAAPRQSDWLEIGVVGDFEPQAIIDAVAATFGTLPARAATRPDYAKERQVQRLAPPQEKTFRFHSKIPRAVVTVLWPIPNQDVRLLLQYDALTAVLNHRIAEKIREELGATYSPEVGTYKMNATYTNAGWMLGLLTCEVQDVEKLSRLVRDIARQLAAEGATEDEVERARKPLLKSGADLRRQNSTWLAIASVAQSQPQRLEWFRTITRDYGKVSRDDVNRLAKTYLQPKQAIIVSFVPEDLPQEKAAATPATGR